MSREQIEKLQKMVDDSSRLSSLIRHGKEDLAAYLPKLEAILHPPVDVPEEE